MTFNTFFAFVGKRLEAFHQNLELHWNYVLNNYCQI